MGRLTIPTTQMKSNHRFAIHSPPSHSTLKMTTIVLWPRTKAQTPATCVQELWMTQALMEATTCLLRIRLSTTGLTYIIGHMWPVVSSKCVFS